LAPDKDVSVAADAGLTQCAGILWSIYILRKLRTTSISEVDAGAVKISALGHNGISGNKFDTKGDFYESKAYLKSGDGQNSLEAWDLESIPGRPNLFRRTVDNLIAPCAKAVGAYGYRFSPALSAERFGLNDQQREYIQTALQSKEGFPGQPPK